MNKFITKAKEIVLKDILIHHRLSVPRSNLRLIEFSNDDTHTTTIFFAAAPKTRIYIVTKRNDEAVYYVSEYSVNRTVGYRHQEDTNV